MGVQKNASYKVHNGVDFDEINFKTIAAQVKTAGGSDVESQLAEIVQSGSNGNGTYVRFADGTQICRYSRYWAAADASVGNNRRVWTLPATFIDKNYTLFYQVSPFSYADLNRITRYAAERFDNRTASVCYAYVILNEIFTTTLGEEYIAIGRWK